MKAWLKLQPDVPFQRIPTNFKIKSTEWETYINFFYARWNHLFKDDGYPGSGVWEGHALPWWRVWEWQWLWAPYPSHKTYPCVLCLHNWGFLQPSWLHHNPAPNLTLHSQTPQPTILRRSLPVPNLWRDAPNNRRGPKAEEDSEDEEDLLTADLDDPVWSEEPVPDNWEYLCIHEIPRPDTLPNQPPSQPIPSTQPQHPNKRVAATPHQQPDHVEVPLDFEIMDLDIPDLIDFSRWCDVKLQPAGPRDMLSYQW